MSKIMTNVIDMDKKCAECGKGRATTNQLCVKCTSDAFFRKKPMKSWQGKAFAERFKEKRK